MENLFLDGKYLPIIVIERIVSPLIRIMQTCPSPSINAQQQFVFNIWTLMDQFLSGEEKAD